MKIEYFNWEKKNRFFNLIKFCVAEPNVNIFNNLLWFFKLVIYINVGHYGFSPCTLNNPARPLHVHSFKDYIFEVRWLTYQFFFSTFHSFSDYFASKLNKLTTHWLIHASSHKVTPRHLCTSAFMEWFAVILTTNQHLNTLALTEMTFWVGDSLIHSGKQIMNSSHILSHINDSSCLWITPCLTISVALTTYSFYNFPMPPHLIYPFL